MNDVLKIVKIKYFSDIEKLKKTDIGDWIDLRAACDLIIPAGEYWLIPLGVGMILPEGYEAHIRPRSSTYKNFGIRMVCSGVIDNCYSGETDQWFFGCIADRTTRINKNDRICQFRIVRNQPHIVFEEVDHLNEKSRGGHGSTGRS